MAGYGSSGVGGAATIATSGSEDVNRVFITQTSGTVYFAALVNVSTAGAGTYFMHLKDTSTGFRARVFARNDAGVLRFGLDITGTGTYATNAYSYTTTYLLVTKHNLDTGATALYVLDSFSPSEPATPVVSFTTGTTVTVQAVALRQASGGPSAADRWCPRRQYLGQTAVGSAQEASSTADLPRSSNPARPPPTQATSSLTQSASLTRAASPPRHRS